MGSESKGRVVMGTIAVVLGTLAVFSVFPHCLFAAPMYMVHTSWYVGGGGGEFYNVMEGLNLGDTPTGYAGHLQ